MMTPSTAATIPKPGIASPTVVTRLRDEHRLVMVLLEVEVEDLGEVVVLDGAREQHLEGVAQKRHGVVIVQEGGVLL